jgi:DNA primase
MNSQFDIVEREKIVKWSIDSLWSKDGIEGREYLFDKRKINEDIAKTFRLGYVPRCAENILAGRIIFPIFDTSNNLISIGSRVIDDEVKTFLPTYWHEVYRKSFYLYGLNFAKDEIRKKGYAVVVEGNFDVITSHKEGMKNTVGLMGTAISEFQIALLLRYCEKVIFVFDKDENKAGEKASERVRKKFGQYNGSYSLIDVGFVKLQDFGDPDEFIIKSGILSYKKLIEAELTKKESCNYA